MNEIKNVKIWDPLVRLFLLIAAGVALYAALAAKELAWLRQQA